MIETIIMIALIAHAAASVFVATTPTKSGKLYKVVEMVALVTGFAKQVAPTAKVQEPPKE